MVDGERPAATSPDVLSLAVSAGLAAYLLANLGRGSLDPGTEVTAFPFCIVLGLGAALGIDRAAQSADAPTRSAEPPSAA